MVQIHKTWIADKLFNSTRNSCTGGSNWIFLKWNLIPITSTPHSFSNSGQRYL